MRSQRGRSQGGPRINSWVRIAAFSVVLVGLQTHPASAAQAPQRATVTLGTLELPTYREGNPDPNPPFEAFRPPRINYPYSLRTNLTNERSLRAWRAIFLENEYLRCSVLPDLGGHLYSCTDKISGVEMFYANPSIKLTQIGYRGAWAALGVEFNFPVSHNWMSTSPIDFAFRNEPDGSASVWVGNVDRVVGSDWRVQLRLRPGRAVLEQHTTLYNASDVRHRYYWWTNAAARVTDESWVLYPMRTTASHGFTDLDSWPMDQAGTDNSLVGNHLFGPVSRFSHGSREAFMAVYHPNLQAGLMHYSAPDHLPSKKIWSWGGDERGLDWRRALSDDSSAYVEIQAGLFRNQETYGYLGPQETLSFSEYWTPLRELGGLSRANPDVQLHLCRVDVCGSLPSPGLLHTGEGSLRIRANVTSRFLAATITVSRDSVVLAEERVDLDPWTTLDATHDTLSGTLPFTVRVTSSDGTVLIEHTEGIYDYAADPDERLGSQPEPSLPPEDLRSESDWVLQLDDLERNGRQLEAWAEAERAMDRFPSSLTLRRVAGRLATVIGRSSDAVRLLEPVVERVSNDAEAWYYLGLAKSRLGAILAVQPAFEAALHDSSFRSPARIQLAFLEGTTGDAPRAAAHLRAALRAQPSAPRVAALLSAALRRSDRESEALGVVDQALGQFPSHSFLRYEATRLGAHDPSLWSHLSADGERILEIVTDYMSLGSLEEALSLLERDWSVGEGVEREPGVVSPSLYPLLGYYRAFVRDQLTLPYTSVLADTRRKPLAGVFANRTHSRRVLRWVVSVEPGDGPAHWLLGGLTLQSAELEETRDLWQTARTLRPDVPALHRSLGVLLMELGDPDLAAHVLREGTEVDPTNIGVYAALDDALERLGRPASERADALLAFPDIRGMPAALVYRTARRLAEARRFDEADALFVDRFFPREEGGINVRQVYLEVKIARARAHSEEGDCRSSRQVLDDLLTPDSQLEFTSDGLSLWLDRAGLRTAVDELLATCSGAESR